MPVDIVLSTMSHNVGTLDRLNEILMLTNRGGELNINSREIDYVRVGLNLSAWLSMAAIWTFLRWAVRGSAISRHECFAVFPARIVELWGRRTRLGLGDPMDDRPKPGLLPWLSETFGPYCLPSRSLTWTSSSIRN
jgi:hypothetical protein